MKKLKLFHLIGILTILLAVSVGFYAPISSLHYLCEAFTEGTFPPPGWTVSDSTLIRGGYGYVCFDYWNASQGRVGDLTTPTFYPSVLGDSLKFIIAYCPFGTSPDSITIYTSTNGGNTWTHLFSMSYAYMQTVSSCSHPFIPTASQWGRRGFLLPAATNMIKFHAYSGFGDAAYLDSICVVHPVGIKHNGNETPKVYSLSQNYPNPFNPTTIINYSLLKAGYVELRVYDFLGKECATLVNEFENADNYSVDFNGNNLASGVYFYKLKVNDFVSTKKMLLIK